MNGDYHQELPVLTVPVFGGPCKFSRRLLLFGREPS